MIGIWEMTEYCCKSTQ